MSKSKVNNTTKDIKVPRVIFQPTERNRRLLEKLNITKGMSYTDIINAALNSIEDIDVTISITKKTANGETVIDKIEM